jgi:hypothetical protein
MAFFLVEELDSNAQERERSAEARRAAQEIGLWASREFTRIVYARLVSSSLLHAALDRNAPRDEIVQKKRELDAAFSEWNVRLPAILLGMRRISRDVRFSEFRSLLDTQLTRPFTLVSNCLADAYDARLGIKPKKDLECDLQELLVVARTCSDALTEGLPSEPASSSARAGWPAEVKSRCDVSKLRVAKGLAPVHIG